VRPTDSPGPASTWAVCMSASVSARRSCGSSPSSKRAYRSRSRTVDAIPPAYRDAAQLLLPLDPEDSVRAALLGRGLLAGSARRYPVARDGRFLGLIATRDLRGADPPTPARATATAAPTPGPSPHAIAATISDTGSGMPADVRDRATERFFRREGDTDEGFGLGLAIAAEALEATGAAFELESTPGSGTMARMTFKAGRLVRT